MVNFTSLIGLVFQYPAKEIIKDVGALRHMHKPYRNIWRLMCASVGSVLGGTVPTLIEPNLSIWLAEIMEKFFQISTGPSFITGNLIAVWLGISSGLLVGKYSAQGYYYLRYRDTNSAHLLYPSEMTHLLNLYQPLAHKTSVAEDVTAARKIQAIFFHLVAKIRAEKAGSKVSPIDPIAAEWTKAHYKSILMEFRRGNQDPYDFYVRLSHTKERFIQLKLEARISALDNLLTPGPELGPRQHSTEMSHRNSPSQSFNFRTIVPRRPRERQNQSISLTEVQARDRKLGRYLTQFTGDKGDVRPATEVRALKDKLMAQVNESRAEVKLVPPPLEAIVDQSLLHPPEPVLGLQLPWNV
jgi:hypothetical protein